MSVATQGLDFKCLRAFALQHLNDRSPAGPWGKPAESHTETTRAEHRAWPHRRVRYRYSACILPTGTVPWALSVVNCKDGRDQPCENKMLMLQVHGQGWRLSSQIDYATDRTKISVWCVGLGFGVLLIGHNNDASGHGRLNGSDCYNTQAILNWIGAWLPGDMLRLILQHVAPPGA
jgi:hypothetical protein